ncbi:ABC-type Fe3+ transport system substrate-binding protein [Bosea sp. AK1]|nr:ABC-type Fe3+ transport system substrate-binding protein [Bosea sp. AK1]
MSYKIDRRTLLRTAAMSSAALALAGRGAVAQTSDAALVEAAEKEGQLVIYGDLFTVQIMVKSFNAAYPKIKVTTATGDAWQILNRFISENQAGRPVMDVFWQAEDTIITADGAGMLGPINFGDKASLLSSAIPAAGNYFRGNGQLCLFAWHKDQIGKNPTPRDWTDYIEPPAAWDGLVATTNPASSSATFAVIAALYQHYGQDKGGAILKGLRKINTELVASMGVLTTKLQTGERPIDFFTNSNATAGLLGQGVPVAVKIPESGAVAQFNAVAVSKMAPHPNAAKLFVEHALGKQAQTDLLQAKAYSVRKDLASPDGLPSLEEAKQLKLDLVQALKDRDAILKWWSASTGFNIR